MGFKVQARIIFAALSLVSTSLTSSAQTDSGQRDSLVRLLKAQSIELQEIRGRKLRKTIDATFLHNGTYLICDTALWNVDDKVINCWGNVKLMQEETELTSDRLDYFVDEDLAQFRGTLVQLRNKEDNILRTRNLDYNTRDSVAVFKGGAAMRDEDGQVIESDSGTYESGRKFFTFNGNVNMFTDSVFVKTENLTYDSDRSIANFVTAIDFWKEDNMLSAARGWYNRGLETFFFQGDVHGLTREQESWSDSLYFYRDTRNVKMLGNAHVQDTARNVAGMANYIFYEDSLSRINMRRDAAVAVRTEQDQKIDTLYIGADDLTYWTKKMCDIPESEVKVSNTRLTEILSDPVREYRRKAAEDAAAAAAQAAKERFNPNAPPKISGKGRKDSPERSSESPAPSQSKPEASDSIPPSDSLSVADSLATQAPDTTKKGFLIAIGKVKMFRTDMQVACDSLNYCDLDSIARLYKKPIVWNEGNRQYTSDSLFVLLRGGGVDRASLMSNAFIITQEDSLCYNQIKGTDVVAYFDSTSALSRFDALGGATALFYLKENDVYATVNKVESKMLSATFSGGNLQQVFYFDSPKNDAYPIVQMPESDKRMKGFNWVPEERPKSKDDVTSLSLKSSERRKYEARPKTAFKQTDIYFPGYMLEVQKGLADAEVAKQRRRMEAENAKAAVDSAVAVTDSLVVAGDSLAAPIPAVADSIAVAVPEAAPSEMKPLADDELKATETKSKDDLKKEKKEDREQVRKLRIARRDARWAELDAKNAAEDKAKAEKALQKKRAKTLKAVLRQRKQDTMDEQRIQKYVEKYEKQKARKGVTETPTDETTAETRQQTEEPA